MSLVIGLLARPDLTTRISSSFTRGDQIVSAPLFASLLLISTLSLSLAPTPISVPPSPQRQLNQSKMLLMRLALQELILCNVTPE